MLYNLMGISGRFGSGKSLYAVELAIEAANEFKKPLVFNFPVNHKAIRDYGRAYGMPWIASCVRIKEIDTTETVNTLFSLSDSVVVFDEAGVFSNARAWKSIDKEFLKYLFQVRHLNVHLIVVYQFNGQIDKQIRETLQQIVVCKSLSVYDRNLRMPRIHARFCYHYSPEKLARLEGSPEAASSFVRPWLWASKVRWRILLFHELYVALVNLIGNLLVILFALLGKRYKFKNFHIREWWLFRIFSSSRVVGDKAKRKPIPMFYYNEDSYLSESFQKRVDAL